MAKIVPAKDLRTKTDDELAEIVRSSTNQLFEARFQNYTNRLDDTARLRRLRTDIARAKTVQTERRKGAAAKSEG
jgi:large subunit ribosomal protein L29